ncbi:DNA polymerase III subunit delta [Deferrisoma sp.]
MSPAPVVCLVGGELFLVRRELARLEAEVLAGGDPGLNREVFTAPDATPGQVVAAAQTLPFLGGRRLVVARDAHRWPAAAWDPLVAYLERPNPSTCLVIVAETIDRRTKAGKRLLEAAEVIPCERPKEAEVPRWVERLAKEEGLRLDARVAAALALRVGPDLEQLHQEVQKLRAFAGDGGAVGLDDLERLVGDNREASVFALCDALGLRKLGDAVGALRSLLGMGEPPVRLLYMIVRHFRHLWMARELLDRGGRVSRSEAAKALGAHPFVAAKALEQARGWREPELRRVFLDLVRADLALKTGGGPEVLEALALGLCGRGETQAIRRGRGR